MAQPTEQGPGAASVLLFLFSLFLLASPFAGWWMQLPAPWYVVYLLWLLIIGLSAWLAGRARRHAN